MTKQCDECKQDLPLDNFAKAGRARKCKECDKPSNRKDWASKNKEHIAEYNRKYREANKEKIQSYYKKTDEEKQKNRNDRKKKYFDEFVTIVEKNGGKFLGKLEDYETAHSKIKVKCANGHIWKTCLNYLKLDRWCPKCNDSIGEIVALHSCNYLFDKEFKKIRPVWLKSKSGYRLELDMYNKELGLAVEYNGIQHYKYLDYFHKTEEEFEKRLDDDKIKIQKCEEHNIKLIVIPYTVTCDKICKYIYDEAKKSRC